MINKASEGESMPYLFQELSDASCECLITKKNYIPAQKLSEIITVKQVDHELRLGRRWKDSVRSMFCNHSIENKVERMRKFIAIMALIDRLNDDSIKVLTVKGLTDEDLPLSRDGKFLQCHRRAKKFIFPEWGQASIGLFLDKQWTVLAPILNFECGNPIDVPLDKSCALELSGCKISEVTQFSQIYYAEIPPTDEERKSVPVAIKVFCKDFLKDYNLEKANLRNIMAINNTHLIMHLATCDQIPFIIFPWADRGDLNDFWKTDSEFERTLNVFDWSLKQLTGLASALKDLHGINCRHGDLKPSNILYYQENGVGILKIADLGVSRVHDKETNLRHGVTVTKASTRAYEGPEAYRPDQTNAPRSRRYDCWSMGCIIIEFVIWLLYDNHALECFRGARDSEWNSYYRPRTPKPGSYNVVGEWWETMERHPNVDMAIGLLRQDERVRNTVLEKLIHLVDHKLLQINPNERIVAADIHNEMQRISRQFKEHQIRLVNNVARPSIPSIFSKVPPKLPETTSTAVYSTSTALLSAIQRS